MFLQDDDSTVIQRHPLSWVARIASTIVAVRCIVSIVSSYPRISSTASWRIPMSVKRETVCYCHLRDNGTERQRYTAMFDQHGNTAGQQ